MSCQGESFILFVGRGFIDFERKVLHKRFNIFNLLSDVGEKFTKLSRKEAEQWLERAVGSRVMPKTRKNTVLSIIMLLLSLAIIAIALIHLSNPRMFDPLGNLLLILFALTFLITMMERKEIISRPSAVDIGDNIIIEYSCTIQRFRNPPFYHVWVVVPKTSEGAAKAKRVFKAIRDRVGVTPITEGEWYESKSIRELFVESNLKGVKENLWQSI